MPSCFVLLLLVKKLTVIGIIEKIHGVNMAASPLPKLIKNSTSSDLSSSPFLPLDDPADNMNGAGPLNDFGCYGSDLATWLMHGERPIAVTAVAKHYKPLVYPKVEDDATILVEYATATASIEASWNWALNLKDMEVWGERGVIHAFDGTNVQFRLKELNYGLVTKPKALAEPNNDPLIYLTAVLRGKISSENDQAGLKYNMIAMEILDAAKRSIKEGKRIVLQPK